MDYQQKESLKEKVTIGGIGVVCGAVGWWIVLAAGLGWMSATTAAQHTSDAVQAKVDQVLAPFCANRLMADKADLAKFVKANGDYSRAEVVQNAVPKLGTTRVDYQLSEKCASVVEGKLKSAARKTAPKKTDHDQELLRPPAHYLSSNSGHAFRELNERPTWQNDRGVTAAGGSGSRAPAVQFDGLALDRDTSPPVRAARHAPCRSAGAHCRHRQRSS